MKKIQPADRLVLRNLALNVAEAADRPVMTARRELWRRHNRMEPVRPVVFVAPQGAWKELVPDAALRCQQEDARYIERGLRQRLYVADNFLSDNVIEKEWLVSKVIHNSGWGLEPQRHHSDEDRGAYGFVQVLEAAADLKKLRVPEISYDETATIASLEFFRELFGDILQVRLKGVNTPSYHLMNQFSALRGLQEMLMDMIENPGLVHDAMAFFEDAHRRIMRQTIELRLLSLNNNSSEIYTSGHGYTDELPGPGFDPEQVQPRDMWGWAEAQEMAVVSPEMHHEFAFPYEKRLLEPFGLNGYGCCDDVSRKLDFVLTVPGLRRVSVAPTADVGVCAEQIRDKVIFMWKPQPAHLVGNFDPQKLADYLRHTVEVTRACGCTLEIVLLDTHTCESHPERFHEWTRIANAAVQV